MEAVYISGAEESHVSLYSVCGEDRTKMGKGAVGTSNRRENETSGEWV